MYEVHDWAAVHRLFHREVLSKSRIAERVGMSRNTVARLLSLDEPPRYRRKAAGVEAGSVLFIVQYHEIFFQLGESA